MRPGIRTSFSEMVSEGGGGGGITGTDVVGAGASEGTAGDADEGIGEGAGSGGGAVAGRGGIVGGKGVAAGK